MCGIVGYLGTHQAAPLLLEGLGRLEHRGYDSAGVAVLGPSGIRLAKRAGRVRDLGEQLPKRFTGKVGIGHTRWATHGPANDVNAHPQDVRRRGGPRRLPRPDRGGPQRQPPDHRRR
jgi:glucosamine--fructose-6-phosphate aminotransferase (isomerizing)